MIQSMTGYGKTTVLFQGKKIIIELKSLNSKALDLNTRIAALYREKEMEIRTLIAQGLERGKVDFSIWVDADQTDAATPINKTVLASYYQQLQRIHEELQLPMPADCLTTLLRMPDVLGKNETEVLTDAEWQAVLQGIKDTIQQLRDFRSQEGVALQKKFQEKLDNIAALMASIEPYEKSRVEKIRTRILAALEALPEAKYDANRLEQELIYYIEKLDISEEKQRLANHLKYFTETMETGHGQGKKLGFIAQEMGREINTTGSKSNQAEMQNIVVKMKDELEQIKEQVLNVM